jgi:hypothetical protein
MVTYTASKVIVPNLNRNIKMLDQINYWKELSDYDIQTAHAMLKTK